MSPILLIAALPFVVAVPAAGDDAPTACVEIGGASVWGGVGWNHLVYLTDRCTKTVTCTVSTNVDPSPQEARVEPNATVQVVTALNSEARVFVPSVACVWPSDDVP